MTTITDLLHDHSERTFGMHWPKLRWIRRALAMSGDEFPRAGGKMAATPENMALVIAAVIHGGTGDMARFAAGRLFTLPATGGRCPITQQTTFGAALQTLLADEEAASRVRWIGFFAERAVAKIAAEGGRESAFHTHGSTPPCGMTTARMLSGFALTELAYDLAKPDRARGDEE